MTDPDGITGLHGWYKADAITGLSNGAAVPQWDDSSGFTNHAAQGTAGSQPTYQTNVINGLPVVRFSTDFLNITNADLIGMTNNAAGMTASAVVALATASATIREIFNIAANLSTTNRFKFGQRATGTGVWALQAKRLNADTSVNVEGSASSTNFVILTAVIDWANSDAFLYLNGNLDASTTALNIDGNSDPSNSAAITIGSRADGTSEFWSGDIAELVVYNKALNSTERSDLDSYMNIKYFGAPPVLSPGPIVAVARSGNRLA